MSDDPAEHQKKMLRDKMSVQVRQEALNRQTPRGRGYTNVLAEQPQTVHFPRPPVL